MRITGLFAQQWNCGYSNSLLQQMVVRNIYCYRDEKPHPTCLSTYVEIFISLALYFFTQTPQLFSFSISPAQFKLRLSHINACFLRDNKIHTCKSECHNWWSRWVLHSFSNSGWWLLHFYPSQNLTGMYKNQLQELAQRSCFNLPSYACIREGPDHAPRFKASVNFNGEIFEAPSYCTTLRQAEHAAAEVALNTLSTRGPSRSLAARVLDETGVYKNLLQETAHRAGLNLPLYTTVRSGPGHLPVFTCTVELAGMNFTGEPGKTKKLAEKNAAMAAWSALKQIPNLVSSSHTKKDGDSSEEQEEVVVTRILSNYRPKDENKSLKQRDQNQARRRLVSSHGENNISSSSSCHNTLKYQQWRSMDLISDFSSIYPTQTQNQNQNCFSKILPPTTSVRENKPSLHSSNRAIPVQVRSRAQVNIQEIPPPLEEHQKDEDEWLNGKSEGTDKPAYLRPFPLTHYCSQRTQMRTSSLGSVSTPIAAAPTGNPTRAALPLPNILNTRRFHAQAQGMAPAVHIRTVIPVCAAPPARPLSSNLPSPQMKEVSQSQHSSASVSTKTVEGELSSASLDLNRLQL
ncbi:double-stranded RNA-binding protein 3-like [Telopea speciosissima]|uniref:double-stranded RNA-binding protein 3-like n=1 Tax=Telopea speciosissima TaxID=54955 RepID=UPI001CC534E2|nr:double-stranded RNA-binding protein 3-like [Telopea speciosissima]